MSTISDKQYWIAFNMLPGIGPASFGRLLAHFGDMGTAWAAPARELEAAGLDRRAVASVMATRPKIDPEAEMERLWRQGVQVFTTADASYPARLKEIYDPPPVLFVKGSLTPQDEAALAVVGTRHASAYGREAAAALTTDLARAGVTIVSGLARGIDSVAHQAAVDVGGRTLAIFASGLDIIYPREHARLAEAIVEQGAIISEFHLGVRPEANHFPRRNRILSGLCLGVLVVEADRGSGALITARYALEQDREVFAVPGNIFAPNARGTNRLIQEGAKLVSSASDILEELNLDQVARQLEMAAPSPVALSTSARAAASASRPSIPRGEPASGLEADLWRQLSTEPRHIDEVGRAMGLPIATVSSTLALMELKGLVQQVGTMNYIRAREARADYA